MKLRKKETYTCRITLRTCSLRIDCSRGKEFCKIFLKGHSHEKVVEIIPLNHRLGPNPGTPTPLKLLSSPVASLRFFKKEGSHDVKCDQLIC
jgi:hypothetical protein